MTKNKYITFDPAGNISVVDKKPTSDVFTWMQLVKTDTNMRALRDALLYCGGVLLDSNDCDVAISALEDYRNWYTDGDKDDKAKVREIDDVIEKISHKITTDTR